MNTAEQIILVILGGALAIFLIIGTVVLVKIIQVLNQVKRISAHAEKLAENVENTAAIFQKAAGPMAIIKVVGSIVDHAMEAKKQNESNRKRSADDE